MTSQYTAQCPKCLGQGGWVSENRRADGRVVSRRRSNCPTCKGRGRITAERDAELRASNLELPVANRLAAYK